MRGFSPIRFGDSVVADESGSALELTEWRTGVGNLEWAIRPSVMPVPQIRSPMILFSPEDGRKRNPCATYANGDGGLEVSGCC
jgi:hypothetical protein